MTIQLSMIVVITSWTPTVPFRSPAMPARIAPASMAPMTENAIRSPPGRSTAFGISVATNTAAIEPARYWPWPPMLNRPHRNANATARPVRTSPTQRMSVWIRFAASTDTKSLVSQGNQTRASLNGTPMLWCPTWKNHARPEPFAISL
jgi:hypothetical protein